MFFIMTGSFPSARVGRRHCPYYRTFLPFAQWQIKKVTAYSQIYVILTMRMTFSLRKPP
jgi:hypothetical protein